MTSCECLDRAINVEKLQHGEKPVHFTAVHHWPPDTCPGPSMGYHRGRQFCPYCGTGWQ